MVLVYRNASAERIPEGIATSTLSKLLDSFLYPSFEAGLSINFSKIGLILSRCWTKWKRLQL